MGLFRIMVQKKIYIYISAPAFSSCINECTNLSLLLLQSPCPLSAQTLRTDFQVACQSLSQTFSNLLTLRVKWKRLGSIESVETADTILAITSIQDQKTLTCWTINSSTAKVDGLSLPRPRTRRLARSIIVGELGSCLEAQLVRVDQLANCTNQIDHFLRVAGGIVETLFHDVSWYR